MTGTAIDAPALGALSTTMQAFGRMVTQGRVLESVLKRSRIELTRADLSLLNALSEAANGIRPSDLSDRLAVDAPTVTRRVQQLEARRLVRRASDPLDRRAQLVQLTPAGKRLLERATAAFHAWLESVLTEWSAAERDRLAELLTRFTDDIYRSLECRGN